jgi:hypothetical protein
MNEATFTLGLEAPGFLGSLYDLNGRLVRMDEPTAGGDHLVRFNGRDEQGRACVGRYRVESRAEVSPATIVKSRRGRGASSAALTA